MRAHRRALVDTEFRRRARVNPLYPHLTHLWKKLTPWNACALSVHVDIGARGNSQRPG